MTKEEFYWNVLYSQWDKREEANELFIAEDRVKPRKTQSHPIWSRGRYSS